MRSHALNLNIGNRLSWDDKVFVFLQLINITVKSRAILSGAEMEFLAKLIAMNKDYISSSMKKEASESMGRKNWSVFAYSTLKSLEEKGWVVKDEQGDITWSRRMKEFIERLRQNAFVITFDLRSVSE